MENKILIKKTPTLINNKNKENINFKKEMSEKGIKKIENNEKKEDIKKQMVIEEEEGTKEEKNSKCVSFSLSSSSDLNNLLDNLSDKPDERPEIEYESFTKNEEMDLINNFILDTCNDIQNSRKGFDTEIQKMSSELYKELSKKYEETKSKPYILDKTKTTNIQTKSESLSASEERGLKFRMGADRNESGGGRNVESAQSFSKSKEEKNKSGSNEKSNSRLISGDNPIKSEAKEIIDENNE